MSGAAQKDVSSFAALSVPTPTPTLLPPPPAAAAARAARTVGAGRGHLAELRHFSHLLTQSGFALRSSLSSAIIKPLLEEDEKALISSRDEKVLIFDASMPKSLPQEGATVAA